MKINLERFKSFGKQSKFRFLTFGRILEKEKSQPIDLQLIGFFSDLAGIRTQGPYIKSVLLYQLSYEIVNAGAKICIYLSFAKLLDVFLHK